MVGSQDLWAQTASAPATPATYDASKCASCHAKLVGGKVLHTILTISDCTECHTPSGEGTSSCKGVVEVARGWKLTAPDPDLCMSCHDMTQNTAFHKAVELVGCTVCHDPHSSDFPNHLVAWPSDQVCYQCHDRKDDKANVHTAVKKGECVGCHNPHSGKTEPLLKESRDKVCFGCHKLEKLHTSRVKHIPVTEGRCLECHDPHSSDNPKQTLAVGSALCLKCHDKKARGGLDRPRSPGKRIDLEKSLIHKAVELGDCQDCHMPGHSGPNARLLQKPPPELCYECHERKDENPFVHTPLRVGDCPVCHNPHSSDNERLLQAGPPIRNVCFRCHDDDVTGRNFIHKPVREGLCTNCHDPHGAANPFNLKAGEGKQVCYSCHKVKDDVKNKHRALERYGCTACHDPHGTANRFQLIKPVNRLCQTCHTDKTDGLHVTTFVANGHKITGGADPHNTDRDFSCASCHNPHGSDSPKLLRFGEVVNEVCDWCHGDRTGKYPELKDITSRNRKPKLMWQPDAEKQPAEEKKK